MSNHKTVVIKQQTRKRERRKAPQASNKLLPPEPTCIYSVQIEAQVANKRGRLHISSACYYLTLIICVLATLGQVHSGQVEPKPAQDRRRLAPAAATCFLRPLSISEPSAGEPSRSADRDRYDQPSADDAELDTAGSQPNPTGTEALYDRLAQMSPNTSVQFYRPDRLAGSEASQTTLAGGQVAFGSICNGWRNSLEPGSQQPPAYWVYDKVRGVLIAKFLFYTREQYLDISSHVARLTSPIFRPIPAYHSMQDSRYYSTCRATFRAYLTIAAHLEFSLVLLPTAISGAGAQQAASQRRRRVPQAAAKQQSHLLKEIMEGKVPRGKALAERDGEQAAWTDHQVVLPHDLGPNGLYQLEFAAMPGTVSSSAVKQGNYLNGVAIANFSLTPQCFGLQVDEAELERIKSITGVDLFQLEDAELELANQSQQRRKHQPTNQQHGSVVSIHASIAQFFDTYKVAVMLCFILVLVAVVCLSLYLLCAYHQVTTVRKSSASAALRRSIESEESWTSWLCRCCCCFRFCWPRAGRRRVYATTGKSGDPTATPRAKANHHLGASELDKFRDAIALEQHQRDGMRDYLRPLQSALDNLELSENPNYLANGTRSPMISDHWQAANRALNVLLQPYHIDRKRLTLTKPLGKGAFGEVYQGYLICYCSNDDQADEQPTLKAAAAGAFNADSAEDDSDSHSVKVAVKTLTDERMSQNDFIREASNMSLVRHRNIVELIGVCFDEEPLYIVMELLQGGNLKQFLIRNRDRGQEKLHQMGQLSPTPVQMSSSNQLISGDLPGPSPGGHENEERVCLSMGDLLVFALDIARACDYLQKRQFIHRDLAARNCLLTASTRLIGNGGSRSPGFFGGPTAQQASRSFSGAPPSALDVNANHKVDMDQVFLDGYQGSSIVAKLADFGMTRDIYSTDYYRMGHKEMPVRWMPPECLDGVATTKSDVWSFGVFLWELFSMGQMPYQGRQNQQVIELIKSRRHAKPKRPQTQNQSVGSGRNGTMELAMSPSAGNVDLVGQQQQPSMHQSTSNAPLLTDTDDSNQTELAPNGTIEEMDEVEVDDEEPWPLPAPHDNTPHPIYSIMCACWSIIPEERPQFEEIANRLYWCLQMPEVLSTSLPYFNEHHGGASLQQSNQPSPQPQPLTKSVEAPQAINLWR